MLSEGISFFFNWHLLGKTMGDNAQRWVVVTDLDGSLLDHHTYSFEAALPALSVLKEEGIPLILNTSKTRSECQDLAQKLGLLTPIVVENGGGISFPDGRMQLSPTVLLPW